MKQSLFTVAAIGLLAISCGVAPVLPAVQSTATRAWEITETALPPTAEAPAESPALDVRVGYAMDGGWYQLFFTNPANQAADSMQGGPDGPLAAAIDAAHSTVDAAIYSLTLDTVTHALIRAHTRGVQVRVVMESDNIDADDPQALKDAGIPLIGDRSQGLMHNKFMIVDGAEVWTGSMNFTKAGTYWDNNNLIRIMSPQLAQDYETEFEEMFTDDHFGPDRGRPTPRPHIAVDGTPVDVYFSPDDHVQTALLKLVRGARSSIYFLAYTFTSDPLSSAIQERAAAGVTVSGVMDADQVKTTVGAEFDTLRAAGLDVRLDGGAGLMHHKVFIIDGQTVVTGSYNFTASADRSNDENVLVIHSPEIASQYLDEFRRVYGAAPAP